MPNLAFLLTILGALFIYAEFLRPGKLTFGLFGVMLTLIGIHLFWMAPHNVSALWLLAASFLLFLAEAVWYTFFLAALAATALLALAFWKFCPDRPIAWPLLIPGCALLGAITTVLLTAAKRARRNKRADL